METWQRHWQHAQSNPLERAMIALMLLNGLDVDDLRQLDQSHIDVDQGWIRTASGKTYPLVSYARDALRDYLENTGALAVTADSGFFDQLAAIEEEAHRLLAGAIWFTNDELQTMLQTIGGYDIPIMPLRYTFPFSIVGRMALGEQSEIAIKARSDLQRAADWLIDQTLTPKQSYVQRLVGLLRQGSLIFMLTSTLVSGLNLIHNILMGRLLSPADYSQLTFIVTLQLLLGMLPTILQTVVSRFVARYQANKERNLLAILTQQAGRLGWLSGFAIAAIVMLLSPALVEIFQLQDVGLILPIAIALPFFIRMGPDRGTLQGMGSYHWLSGAYLTEGGIRLGMSVLLGYALLSAGRALEGAIWGLAQSMIASFFMGWMAMRHFKTKSEPVTVVAASSERADWLKLGLMTSFALIGQILITNSDFLLVKNFFTSDEAGLYAAVSVLGRIVYFGALPLTIVLVPMIARKQALNQPTRQILVWLVGGGTLVCSGLIAVAALFAPQILSVYGTEYIPAAHLLAPYAIAASLYTITNLVITYQISLGSGGETWMPILAGIAQIVAVFAFHESLDQVILIQIILMGMLLAIVLWRVMRQPQDMRILPKPLAQPKGR